VALGFDTEPRVKSWCKPGVNAGCYGCIGSPIG
jgi:hypothetical protein